MDLYSRNGNGRPASSDHFIRTNASVRGKELTIVSLLDANIGSLILHFHELYLLSLLHLMKFTHKDLIYMYSTCYEDNI